MRVLCRHGHFAFFQTIPGEISLFTDKTELELERDGEFYTFPFLVGAPRYSLAGKPYLNATATKTFEGRASWDVLQKNELVYSIASETLVPVASISISIGLARTGRTFVAETPLIQPGSRLPSGQRVMSYDGHIAVELLKLRVSEFQYD